MKKILLLIFACAVYPISWGQDRSVSGTVVSENGFPMKNIKLSVVDVPISAKTNKNGVFTLKKVRSEDTIIVHITKQNYIKFPLGDNDSLKLILSDKMVAIHNESNIAVNTPILTGTSYNNETRSIAIITSKMIERRNALTLVDAIKGMIPGVNIGVGASGEHYAIIRGQKSLNLSNNALVLVDGMETTLEHANSISVHDIATIEVNKDGFGYGVKGANGVIIINTKK